MASNATTIADEDGDFEDWIELFNRGAVPINLNGWGLSDNYSNPFKWVFPNIIINPGEHILIWASGKDRVGSNLHTNFSIDSYGEEILLVQPSGVVEDEISPLHIPTDISYGRYPDGTDNFYFYNQASPGNSNTNSGYSELLEHPIFSNESGFYTNSFYLKIHHPDPEVVLRYTIDGSIPSVESDIFPDSLLVTNRKNDPNGISDIPTTSPDASVWHRWNPPDGEVFKGLNLRVKAFKEGALSLSTLTKSYWVDNDIFTRYEIPIVSISMEESDLLGPSGIYTNYNRRGIAWERPAHIAFFEPNGIQGFATDAGVRVHGGNSRRYAQKSFRIYFRNRYGDSRIDYPIFPDQAVNVHERLILRNGGSDWAKGFFRDAFAQSLLDGFADVEKQAYRPAAIFLNGEYWGIMNIRERYDNKYIKHHFNQTEFDMLEGTNSVIYGTSTHYRNLITFLQNNNLQYNENYQWVMSQMDVNDFRDYHILQIFSMNTDQPGKNVRFWRPQTSDGKWRWMLFDVDDTFRFGTHNEYDRNGLIYCIGLNSINAPVVNQRSTDPPWAPNGPTQTFPLRTLLGNPEFTISFLNRFADLLNTTFLPNHLETVIDSFNLIYRDHIEESFRRWHSERTWRYDEEVDYIHEFAANRKYHVQQQIVDFFELDGTYNLEVNVGSGKGFIRVNTIDINSSTSTIYNPVYPWSGEYFNNIPVEIRAIPALGYTFSHWEGYNNSNDPVISINTEMDAKLLANFIPDEKNKTLIYFWYFNNGMSNNQPLKNINPTYSLIDNALLEFTSCFEGYPFSPEHELWRKASMERRNIPTNINYKVTGNNGLPYNEAITRGIQIKQPLSHEGNESNIVFHLPTTGFKYPVFKFAAIDEGAADALIIDYSYSQSDPDWTTEGITYEIALHENYKLYTINFADAHNEPSPINNNPHFKIRIRFSGYMLDVDMGNRVTFNNFSLEGIALESNNLPPYIVTTFTTLSLIEDENIRTIDISEVFTDPDGDFLTFSANSSRPNVVDAQVIGSLLEIKPFKKGSAIITLSASDGVNPLVSCNVNVLVYPQAIDLNFEVLNFNQWEASNPSFTYPDYMIFLQSDLADPGLNKKMLHAYYIEPNEYHSDDQNTIGFPYNNTRRTRINGLGLDGISFINAGQERGLGGVLAAINTTGINDVNISWTGNTLQKNEREYAIRLKYRVGYDGDFIDVLKNEAPVEYLANEIGHMESFAEINLHQEAMDKNYVQLLWHYYYVKGQSGLRSELGIKDISISKANYENVPNNDKKEPEIFASDKTIYIDNPIPDIIHVNVHNITGEIVLSSFIKGEGSHTISTNLVQGIYLVTLQIDDAIITEKIFIGP